MALCKGCGTNTNEDVKYCPNCGAEMMAETKPQVEAEKQQSGVNDFTAKVAELNNTADTTADYDANDIQSNKLMAVFSYLGILCLIPIFAAKESKFARFHANQGVVLLIASVAYSIASTIVKSIILAISYKLSFLTSIISFVSIVFTVLAVIGIINAVNGKAKELPVIGKLKILK